MGIRLSDGKRQDMMALTHLSMVVAAMVVIIVGQFLWLLNLADDRAEDRRLIAELIEAEVEQSAVLCQTGALTGEGCEDE